MLRSLLGRAICAAVVTVVTATGIASADVFNMPSGLTSLQFVPVGNPGNAGEWSGESYGGSGPDRICGAVAYTYKMGKYEVTAGQYCEFLNAVAKTDTYGLYNTLMVDPGNCNIKRTGSPGNYTYSVASDWANRPVNHVSFWDACRFANWLHNGQPTGAQGPSTTEKGAYTLDGYNGVDGRTIQRNPNARWAVPSEDEWYKAAYHKNDGVTGNYWDYPTATNSVPSNVVSSPDPGNNANYYDYYGTGNGTWSIGSPYYRTEVGEFENSDSPYQTFDQGGNVWEWNESIVYEGDSARGIRGGSFNSYFAFLLSAAYRNYQYPSYELGSLGFRVAEVPEPGCAGLFLIGCLLSAWRGGRRK